MPYNIKHSSNSNGGGSGFKVVSPNHPQGFSKHSQSLDMARRQQRALYANSSPISSEKKEGGCLKVILLQIKHFNQSKDTMILNILYAFGCLILAVTIYILSSIRLLLKNF